jgi:hypothetical protein
MNNGIMALRHLGIRASDLFGTFHTSEVPKRFSALVPLFGNEL